MDVAAATVLALVVASSVFGVAWAVSGEEAVSDTWVGGLGAVTLYGGLVLSFGAFVAAVVSKARHDQGRWLLLPLALFPMLLALVLLVELVWAE